MGVSARGKKKAGRTASREVRRGQLIRATIHSIARRGISATTLADVAREAGLSQGIVNLHFDNKEGLLNETLRFLADEYQEGWEKALAAAGEGAQDRLSAMVNLDFSGRIMSRDKIAVWFAFWGEAKARPTYRKLCRRRDRMYREAVLTLCEEIVAEGGYAVDPKLVADGLSALTDGLWLDRLLSPARGDGGRALSVCRAYLSSFFPDHRFE